MCNLCFPLLLLYMQLHDVVQFQWACLVGRQIVIDTGDTATRSHLRYACPPVFPSFTA
jgi:hypothetical protein